MTAYALVLLIHAYLRWLVLVVGVAFCVRSFRAWRQKQSWEQADERLHVVLVALFDTQFLLGLLLYAFLSPLPRLFFADLSNSMKNPTLRFFGMEHEIAMFVATAVIHIGRIQSRRMGTNEQRHRRVWVTTLFILLILLAAIPWPGLPHGRPLFRNSCITDAWDADRL